MGFQIGPESFTVHDQLTIVNNQRIIHFPQVSPVDTCAILSEYV